MQRINSSLVPLARQFMVPSRTFFFRHNPRTFLVDMTRQMEDMERIFSRLERQMNSSFREPGFGSQLGRFLEPSSQLNGKGLPNPTVEVETPATGEKGAKYIVKLDVGPGFNPEDIKVSIKDRVLTLHAKLEHKSEDGTSRMYQEMSRSFTLPQGVNVEEIKSLFTPEGLLTIEAPLPEVEAPKPKEIPISVESAENK